MKTFLILTLLIATSTLHAQTVTITRPYVDGGGGESYATENIPVLAGETLEILAFLCPTPSSPGARLIVNDVSVPMALNGVLNHFQNVVIAGPATVRAFGGQGLIFTYRMTPNTTVASQAAAAQAVIIPADTIAPVDVILETSTDFMTWIAALPGNYATSPSKRFFRVRTLLH